MTYVPSRKDFTLLLDHVSLWCLNDALLTFNQRVTEANFEAVVHNIQFMTVTQTIFSTRMAAIRQGITHVTSTKVASVN